MRRMMEVLDNFVADARIVFSIPDDQYAPLLRAGDTVELVTDYSEGGVKLAYVRDTFLLARIHAEDALIAVTDILKGETVTYTEEQAEDLPVAVLGSVTQIAFK